MPDKIELPELNYQEILPTRDTIHGYARLIGDIRGKLTPMQKDYWNISLRTGPFGFRTTPIPSQGGYTFELLLDLIVHSLTITTSQGYTWSIPLAGQPLAQFTGDVLEELDKLGIHPAIEIEKYKDNKEAKYNIEHASNIFRFYSIFDMVLKEFNGSLAVETSPVQLWPHHMDIAFSSYTAGKSRENKELITFGFLTGDESIEEPYFYIKVYPELKDISGITLSGKAYWHTGDWQGVILNYSDLKTAGDPRQELLDHLKNTFDQIAEKA